MSQKTLIKVPTPNGVQNGQTLTWNLTRGQTYHGLILNMGGNSLASFGEVRLNINGQTRFKALASEIDMMNQFDRLQGADSVGRLFIHFDRPGLRTIGAREETAIDTGAVANALPNGNFGTGVTSFTLEIDIKTLSNLASITVGGVTEPAGSNAGASATSKLTGLALTSVSKGNGAGSIKYINVHNRTVGQAGSVEFSDLFTRPTEVYLQRVFISLTGSGSPALTDFTFRRDNYELWYADPVTMNSMYINNESRAPQSGWFVFDTGFDSDGFNFYDLAKAQDKRIILNVSAECNVRMITETIGVL